MYTIEEIIPYVRKHIRCLKNFESFKKDKWYLMGNLYDIDNSEWFPDDIEFFTFGYSHINNYEIDIFHHDIDGSDSDGSRTFQLHLSDSVFKEGDGGFSKYFEPITKPELRQRKIKSILK